MYGKNIDTTATGGWKASVMFKTKASPKCYIGNSFVTGHFSPPIERNSGLK
jgi:hypothetical protein